MFFSLGVRSRLMEGWDPLWWVFGDIGDKEKDVLWFFFYEYIQKYLFFEP